MPIRLQDILLQLIIRVHGAADIAHRHGEDSLPGCAFGAGVRPRVGDGVLGAGGGCVGGIGIPGDVVGV